MAGKNSDSIRCSFCDKTQDQVKKMIAGPAGVYICKVYTATGTAAQKFVVR